MISIIHRRLVGVEKGELQELGARSLKRSIDQMDYHSERKKGEKIAI